MIRHNPSGSGHPYTPDSDQRYPVLPVAGEPVTLGVRAAGDDAVGVEVAFGGATELFELARTPRSSRGQVIDGGHLASAQAKARRGGDTWSVVVDVPEGAEEMTYRFMEGSRRSRWFRTPVAHWERGAAGLVEVDGEGGPIEGSVEALVSPDRIHRIRWALPLEAGEKVAGFGERFDRLDQRGTALDSVVFEQYKSQGEHRRTYMPMPFAHVVGGRGWGFHVRTSRRVWFDMTGPDRIVITSEADAPRGAEAVISLALYSGSPSEVLRAFLDEAGHPVELPESVFGLWASGNEWNTQAEVMRQVDLHLAHDIPISSLVIEAWSDESTFVAFRDAQFEVRDGGTPLALADFTFPADGAWPDPKAMVDALHEQDIALYLWQIPLVKMRPHPTGQARAIADWAVDHNQVLTRPDSRGDLVPYRNRGWWFPLALMPDLSDEGAALWWTEQRRYLVEELGVDGFKTDGGEHAWGADVCYLNGRGGAEMNNLFPVHYAKAYGDLLTRCGKAPLTFSRSGFTGSQAHGMFWAGDENSTWEAFRWSMIAGLNASASGILYWGWDIAGFSGPVPSPELYVRAMAASVFVPIMQYHSEFNHHRQPSRDRTPWNIAEQGGDPAVIDDVRDLVHLRERLRPYLVASAREAIASSTPLMRPLYFAFPDEPVWEDIGWMLGEDILVYPVLDEGAMTQQIYLPRGSWIDARTGEQLAGSRSIDVDVEHRTHIPVFLRREAGALAREAFGLSESRD